MAMLQVYIVARLQYYKTTKLQYYQNTNLQLKCNNMQVNIIKHITTKILRKLTYWNVHNKVKQ